MSNKTEPSQRFVKFIKQQLEVLKEERDTVKKAVDDCIIQVQNEIDAWISGGKVSKATCEEISIRIQQAITFFIEKCDEITSLQSNKSGNEQNQNSFSKSHDSTSHTVGDKLDTEKSDMMLRRKQVPNEAFEKSSVIAEGVDTSHIPIMRFAILEEAVFSLKKTAEKIQEKQENMDRILQDVSTQQGNVNKKVENYNKTNLNFKKKTQKTFKDFEKKSNNMSSNIEHLHETVINVDVKLNKFEEENKFIKVTMRELNKQISSVRTCSNDTLMSIQDFSKSVESTNQHYNKMNQLEISINLMSSQYTEQLENMERLNKDKIDSLIGVVCQLVAERLKPIENLKEALNKISTTKTPLSLKVDGIESQLVDLSNKIVQIESKCCLPNVGFYAWGNFDLDVGEYNLENFSVESSYGDHFDSVSGKFITPFNGFYLMSISAKLDEDNSINITCDEKKICQTDKSRSLGMCLGRETITIFAELKKGEQVYLKLFIKKEDMDTDINFSCCRING